MRLFLLPINSRNTLIYAQRLNKQLTADQAWIEKLSDRANTLWLRWEAKESGIQKRVTIWGNKLFVRIPYQEWGLKSIPPLSARRSEDEIKGEEKVEVIFPEKALSAQQVPDLLRSLATDRQAFHRQRMIWSVLGMPLTIPFVVIPVIPNLPFMYLVFRAYSHWKALSGAKHVTYLVQNNLLENNPSPLLQKIYDIRKLPEKLLESVEQSLPQNAEPEKRAVAFTEAVEKGPSSPAKERSTDSEALIASEGTGNLVSLCFALPQIDMEMSRAVQQVKTQIATENNQIPGEKPIEEREKKQ